MNASMQAAIAATREAEYATLTRAGMPIANPLFHYYQPGYSSIDVATGLAYPAKADRARANPKVGLLLGPAVHAHDPIAMLEHGAPDASALADQPVVVIAARAAVRDGDIQANTDRYIGQFLAEHPKVGPDWDLVKTKLHYWARIWVECVPVRVLFWPEGRIDSEAPLVWQAAADAEYPQSDRAPQSAPTPRADWPVEHWQQRAQGVIRAFPQPILTAADGDGFPLPFPVLGAELAEDGFALTLARHGPWEPVGPACLSFGAMATFLGALDDGDVTRFRVSRLIGNLPHVFDTPDDQLVTMMGRLRAELDRRSQSMPVVERP
ncbi:MAG: hypothetical protein VB949_13350 [Pseudomonadales bacterium]|jgi:hypothetical protein